MIFKIDHNIYDKKAKIMCEPGPHIKLCTCGNVEAEEPYWILRRGDSVSGYEDMMGSFPGPRETFPYDNKDFLLHKIIFDLNNNPVFDFEYSPQAGDAIQIVITEIDFDVKFTFCYEEWRTEDRMLSGGEKLHSGEVHFRSEENCG